MLGIYAYCWKIHARPTTNLCNVIQTKETRNEPGYYYSLLLPLKSVPTNLVKFSKDPSHPSKSSPLVAPWGGRVALHFACRCDL